MADHSMFWAGLSNGKKVSLLVGVIVIVAASFFAFQWITQEPYKVLFKDLEARDASNVVSELEQRKIDYRFENNGSNILIPESQVHEVRIKLMGSNMPMVGGVGFEVFDNADFGMTEFVQKINYQRALEGELTRTIMALSEVRYARVHLVMLEEGLFQQKDRPAQASVTLFTHNDQELAQNKIRGMQRLVAASVPGLSISDVTITDQGGRVLSQDKQVDAGALAVSDRLRQKQSVETYLIEKASKVLVSTFGGENASVSIDAELDFSQVSTSSETVLPGGSDGNGAVVRRRESRGGGQGKNAEGNLSTEVEYRLGTRRETRTELPGKVSRLTVGVIVPDDVSEDRRAEIQKVVEMAVGFDAARGDVIAVSSGAPDTVETPTAPTTNQPEQRFSGVPENQFGLEITESKPDPFSQALDKLSAWALSNPQYLLIGFMVLVFALLALLLLARKKAIPSGEPARLSETDRERLLLEIQDWVGRETHRTDGIG